MSRPIPLAFARNMHQGRIVLKEVLTGHNEHPILEETERGEATSAGMFEDRSLSDVYFERRGAGEFS
jgi:hypothetical protein